MVKKLLEYLPHGNLLDDAAWRRRHVLLEWVLLLHLPGLLLFGLVVGQTLRYTVAVLAALPLCSLGGRYTRSRRFASLSVTAGLVYTSAALVALSRGTIEAHFHFFIIVGFIALYQDWVPFLWNIAFTVVSHGLGSWLATDLIFNHSAGQTKPWVWSAIHGTGVLAACVGAVIFWRNTEQEQRRTISLSGELAAAEIGRRRFTSDLLVNLARRNQSLLYRQLGVINQLEEQETDPDALAELFRLDHLATRIRRNAESLLVLSGEDPPRTWSRPVPLVDVVRAAIAETEDLERVDFDVQEHLGVSGRAVADLTHLLAELVENAVRFSPPEAKVTIRTRPFLRTPGAHVLTVEDWGVGMPPEDLAGANELLASPKEVDLSVSQQLGLQVVARLAQRHGIEVTLTATPGGGITAAVVLPPPLFADAAAEDAPASPASPASPVASPVVAAARPAPASPAAHPAPAANGAGRAPAASGAHTANAARAANGTAGLAAANGSGRAAADPAAAGPPDSTWPGWFPPIDAPPRPIAPLAAEFGPPAVAAPARPAPAPPAPAPTQPAAPPGQPGLSRRVPQAHLAPQLRRPAAVAGEGAEQAPPPGAPLPEAERARAALSRFQASRQAAQALIEGGAGGSDAR